MDTQTKTAVFSAIAGLVRYALERGLIQPEDHIYTVNRLLEALELEDYQEPELADAQPLEGLLAVLLDDACGRGLIENTTTARDLFDAKLMGCLTPRPSEVIGKFWQEYQNGPEKAAGWYYQFSQDTDYIRTYRVKKDLKWITPTEYGDLVLTVNLSKPEKDPKEIAAAKNAKQSGYPQCLLCKETEGYAGRINFPARQNHRVIPITLGGERWGFQYSPYVYYNEHCIVFHDQHIPMKISRKTFERLFHFIDLFPQYFIGSNADLPIVGGSILTHEHFQGGRFEFPMEKAPVEEAFVFPGFEDVEAGIVKWPMSVLRISGEDSGRLVELASLVLNAWRGYTDERAAVYAETGGEPHNTITPIARKRGGRYELDLVLRNNRTTPEHPLGIFHPHEELHHIKKENIGLIEVMGLAVLPARLQRDFLLLKEAILSGGDVRGDRRIAAHTDWVESFLPQYPEITAENLDGILKKETGLVFLEVLKCAGVFKRNADGKEAFRRFLSSAAGK